MLVVSYLPLRAQVVAGPDTVPVCLISKITGGTPLVVGKYLHSLSNFESDVFLAITMASNRENFTLTPQHSHWSQTVLQANYWNGYAAAQSATR